ncbi:Alg9-like mannosyltransferase family-domain-containing protein [Fomitopsis serialis]|uniref:Alg9-like mannosyltransferase family-domain-containing protein n=1 Tax=Fomitopsis serialis TaxID=139415 RepID=UPI0020084CEE|nr:Alg9-like mannosyltransferase family-domain-containing protein [Neoantrodia serialis]KAH9924841.1 Alg9-like mannosyltransferase family-domain-containing protein [Neoantrodia serialis]
MPATLHYTKKIGWGQTYFVLLVLRLFFAFGRGYIHPDEHDADGGITLGKQFGFYTLPSKAWDPSYPRRSILTPVYTSGMAYQAVQMWLWPNRNPYAMFVVERLSMFYISLWLDSSVLELVIDPADRMRTVVLLASSFVMLTFQVRPFSNSLEAVCVATCLSALKPIVHPLWHKTSRNHAPELISLAISGVLGVFMGPTFLAFALPIIAQALLWTIRRASQNITSGQSRRSIWARWLELTYVSLTVAATLAIVITVMDTILFRGKLSSDLISTPLNALHYHLFTSNPADHGPHLSWLHLLDNLSLIVGPGLLYYGIRAARELWKPPTPLKSNSIDYIDISKTSLYVIVFSISVLTALHLQDRRFFVPLLVPFIVLVGRSQQIKRLGKVFWTFWFVFNVVFAITFGVLHQGGVVPSLMNLHDRLGALNHTAPPEFNGTLASGVYWKTYPPPWHLLAPSLLADTSSDLKDVPSEDMLESVVGLSSLAQETFLVAPLYAMHDVPGEQKGCLELQERIYPHLDLEHLPQALGIYTANAACLDLQVVGDDGASE